MLNMGLMDEWGDIFRAISYAQPHVAFLLFLYIMFVTLGALNVVIGTITERTMAATEKEATAKEERSRRAKMVEVIKLADELFEDDATTLTCDQLEDIADPEVAQRAPERH